MYFTKTTDSEVNLQVGFCIIYYFTMNRLQKCICKTIKYKCRFGNSFCEQ